jgi:hypothetical protein
MPGMAGEFLEYRPVGEGAPRSDLPGVVNQGAPSPATGGCPANGMPRGRELKLRAKAPIFFIGIFHRDASAYSVLIREIFVTEQY